MALPSSKIAPEQGEYLHKRCAVIFHRDVSDEYYGTVIRHDAVPPFNIIIHLDNGRVLLATECQWRPL